MPCYADSATLDDIRRMFAYVFDPATPSGGGLPQLELFTHRGPVLRRAPGSRAGAVLHGQRPILGFRFGGFAYLTDCSRIPDESWPLLDGLDVLVLDALRERAASDAFLAVGEALDASRAHRRRAHLLHAHVPRSAARRHLRAAARRHGAGL